MIAFRNMFLATILVLSILGSTFARVYLLDGSSEEATNPPQSSPLKQPQLNTTNFQVNLTTPAPSPPTNHTHSRQLDLNNPVYYDAHQTQPSSKTSNQLTYNETNFTYGNLNLRRASQSNGATLSANRDDDDDATKSSTVTLDNGYVPISRATAAAMSRLQIAHLMNSGVRFGGGQMATRRQQPAHPSRPLYAKPPHGASNWHKISAQISQPQLPLHGTHAQGLPFPTRGKQGQAPSAAYPFPSPSGSPPKLYYETQRRPTHGQMAYKPQKRQPVMASADRFRPSKPFAPAPGGVEKHHHLLKTNISSAFQRQFVQNPAFTAPGGQHHAGRPGALSGSDSKATGDESLDNYQTLGPASPQRVYRPAPLTGPFYTYPSVMRRPSGEMQGFAPGRTPSFPHGNLGDRYPLRQHPQAISTSLKNNSPISLPPGSLQNINFESAAQPVHVLRAQPELTSQYASSFPTLSEQINQYDHPVAPFGQQGQGQGAVARPTPTSRNPYQPSPESPTPTRISSSLLNAGHGLSGQNPYLTDDLPTVYKVHGTYTESPKKKPPMKPSVQYDEDSSSGLSAILNANYRQPEETASRYKPEEGDNRFKPEDAAVRYKNADEPIYRYKTEEPRYKPQEDETRYKPEESSYDFKAKETSESRYKPNNRPSLPGPPYDDDEEIPTKYSAQNPIREHDDEFRYNESPSSYDAPLHPKTSYNSYQDNVDKSPSYPPYPPGAEPTPGSVQDILSEGSGKIPSTRYGVPDASLHGNSYDPHGGGHKKGGHVHTFVKTTKDGHFKWGVRHSASAR